MGTLIHANGHIHHTTTLECAAILPINPRAQQFHRYAYEQEKSLHTYQEISIRLFTSALSIIITKEPKCPLIIKWENFNCDIIIP